MHLSAFRLERYFAAREFTAPHLLCASDCESMRVGDLLAREPGAGPALDRVWLGYTESAGAPALRSAIAERYEGLAADDVLVHTGAEEAILTLAAGVLAPGDHVVVHTPCYQSLLELPAAMGCRVTPWVARRERGWALDVDELAALLTPATRMVVLNTPHNPTGWLMDRAAFDAVVALCRSRGIVLFADEVYRGLEYDAAARLPAACDAYEHGVSLGVLSKAYGLPGLRVGWLATRRRDLLARAAAVKDYTTICGSAPSEHLAAVALRHGDALVDRCRAIVGENLPLLHAFMARHADRFAWTPPTAGPIAFPTLLGDEPVDAFCDRVLAGCGVLLLPGTVFDPASRELRIGLGRTSFPDVLSIFDTWLGH